MRVKVKSEKVDLGLARLVSKSFALKFLRKAVVGARIQVIKNPPPAIREGYHLDEHPDHEVWQVWAGVKQALVEVVGPREVLPFVAAREVCRCRLNMELVVLPLKGGGVRLQATEIPKPEPHEGHGKTSTCECLGSKNHDACAKAGCAVCKSMSEYEAVKLRVEAEAMIDSVADKELAKILKSDQPATPLAAVPDDEDGS